MSSENSPKAPSRATPNTHQRGADKLARIPVRVETTVKPLRKPSWIRSVIPGSKEAGRIRTLLRQRRLSTVCEEAACPNLGECFDRGTASFMIMGDLCTRRCPFCDVAHGHPLALDEKEPARLGEAIHALGLSYVVITSVNRDDLPDGGAAHFAACIRELRRIDAALRVEILVPDFRRRQERALVPLRQEPPDVFNHNLETVPRLYPRVRPGADYHASLALLRSYKEMQPGTPTKSGLMLGLGETGEEVVAVMEDLLRAGCDMLTLGQYLQPGRAHLPVSRYVTPEEFEELRQRGEAMGFSSVASAPLVRSSYHADVQADPVL